MNEEPWYAEGLRFKCTECGQCCTGSPGYTWVTEEEITTIAQHMKLSVEEFSRKFVRLVGDRLALLENAINYDCVFLKDKKCQIYSVRPKQCRTFPWWTQNLKSLKDWNEAARFCEGINPDAPLVSLTVIQESLNAGNSQ
jgi:Fe-S-cluster containining protein